MNKSLLRIILLCFVLILSIVLFVSATGTFQCFFIQNTTCPSGTARLIGVENDTEGFQNAHAQNNTFSTYNYSICCNTTNTSININDTCPGNVTVLKLSNGTNAHVEIGTNSNYSYSVCLGSDWKHVRCSYTASACPAGKACVMRLAGSEGINSSNAHVGNCSVYNLSVCCGLENEAPTNVSLVYPVHNNNSVFERKPNFNWTNSTDADDDAITYTLNITSDTASCDLVVGSISTSNYTISSALCVDTPYNWSVIACDDFGDCNTSITFNFTIVSTANLELLINTTEFGSMSITENNDTTDDSPTPLVVRNTGNVLINVSINATALFASVSMNTYYYQFKADENESNSYDTGCSQHASFANMDNASSKIVFCNLSYETVSDEGEIELNITVPADEPPSSSRTSSMEIGGVKTE